MLRYVIPASFILLIMGFVACESLDSNGPLSPDALKRVSVDNYAVGINNDNPHDSIGMYHNISMEKRGIVRLDLVNLLGQQIATVYEKEHLPGTSAVSFSTAAITHPGTYIVRITVNSELQHRRIVVIR